MRRVLPAAAARLVVLVLLVVSVAACASRTHVTLPAVGPSGAAASAAATASPAEPATGELVVYSDAIPVAKHRSPPEFAHTGYVVRKAGYEQVVAQVDNRVSEADETPDALRLPPGLYEVDARCAGLGTVLVPVVIEAGRRTEVYLDAGGMPAKQAAALTDPVRLPDGKVVGARP